MNPPTPYTIEDLRRLLPYIKDRIQQMARPNARPLPKMTVEECMEMHVRLMDIAGERALTLDECFLHGQLMSQYRQAVTAEVLGKKGRYYVISEDDVAEMVQQQKDFDPWDDANDANDAG